MTKTFVTSAVALFVALAAIGAAGPFQAQAVAAQVSAKVGVPLKAAQDLIQQRKYKGALAKLNEAEGLVKGSAYERYVINTLKTGVYQGLRNYNRAAQAAQAALASGQAPGSEKAKRLKQIVQLYSAARNYRKIIKSANAYLKQVGSDPGVQYMLAQTYSARKDFSRARASIKRLIADYQRRGRRPKEAWLSLLRFSEHALNNTNGERAVLEKLVRYYPKPKYWEALIVAASKTIQGRTSSLDIARIKYRTGGIDTADEFMNMAQDALQQHLPGEAATVVKAGIKKGVLGTGPQKDRHLRLANMAKRQVAQDRKVLSQRDKAAADSRKGEDDVMVGMSYWAYGESDKALAAIERGIKQGVTDTDDAQLRLGIVLLTSGKESKARRAFKPISKGSSAAKIAELWNLYAASN